MSNSIKISPKHGLNATIPVCFFCGKEKNEIALMGKIGGRNEDIKAPMHCVIDYEPCDGCATQMAAGITLIGVSEKPLPNNNMPIDTKRNLYPTGQWCVLTEEGVKNIFDEESSKTLIEKRKGFLASNVLSMILGNDE